MIADDNNKECPLLRDTDFVDLMKRRIFNVLLIANPYDAFMLEDDGRVEEKIFDEYAKLGLRYPPRFFQVASQEEAEEELLPLLSRNDWKEKVRPFPLQEKRPLWYLPSPERFLSVPVVVE